jgi:DNA-nicking Smr family endonuclease
MPKAARTLTVDLHGHDVLTAVDFAMRRVAEAHNNGYESIELVHGSADVEEPVTAGRGRIKWELRQAAQAGLFSRWADPSRTWEKAGSIVLYLKPNPRARPESWSREPPRRHRR